VISPGDNVLKQWLAVMAPSILCTFALRCIMALVRDIWSVWLDPAVTRCYIKTSGILRTHLLHSNAGSLLTGDDDPSGKQPPARPPGAPRPARLASPTACVAVQPPRLAGPVFEGAQLLPQEAVAGEGAEDARSPACNGREGEPLPRTGHCLLLGVHQEIVLPA
jgi:hypothetical protein